VLALVALHRNDLEQTRAHLARARQYEAVYARAVPPYLAWATAAMHDAQGDPQGAMAAMRDVFDLPELRMQNLAIEPALAPSLVRLAVRARDRERSAAVCATADELAALNPHLDLRLAVAAHCRGLHRNNAGDLLDAADRLNHSPRVIAHASALEDAGTALIARDAKRGVRLLDEAFELYREAGATRDELRVRSRLREAGVRRASSKIAHPSGERQGWNSLTSAELRVVRLVAQGLTNRQVAERLYVSSYTVGTHLKHAFDKVAVNSRVELTRLAMERDSSA
jgi:DNA-binding CsgD family transcriptional regulator